MATKIIGTLGGADFTSYSAWLAYLQTLGTLTAPETGQQQNCEMVMTAGFVFSGFTPTASNNLTLTTVPGASFQDQANKPGSYDPSKGAAVRSNLAYYPIFTVSVPYITLEKLQLMVTDTASQGCIYANQAGSIVQDCIIQFGQLKNNYYGLTVYPSSSIARRILVICDSPTQPGAVACTGGARLYSSTIIRPGNYSPTGDGIHDNYNASVYSNNIIMGFTTPINTSFSSTGSNNATDASSLPAGFANSQLNAIQSTEFVNPTTAGAVGTADFRLASTSVKAKDNAATDNANAATDLYGTVRPQGAAPDIGAHEYIAAGGAALEGSASAQLSAAAALSTDIALAGAAVGAATVSGSLVTAIPFDGDAVAAALTFGSLATGLPLAGGTSGYTAVAASLTTAVLLAGAADAAATAAGYLDLANTGVLATLNDQEMILLVAAEAALSSVVVADAALIHLAVTELVN